MKYNNLKNNKNNNKYERIDNDEKKQKESKKSNSFFIDRCIYDSADNDIDCRCQ